MTEENDTENLLSDASAPVRHGSIEKVRGRIDDTLNRVFPYGSHGRYLSYLITRIFLILTFEGPGSVLRRGCNVLIKKLPFLPLNAKIPVLRISIDTYDAAIPLTMDVPLEGRFVSPANHLNVIEIQTRVDTQHTTGMRLTIREGSSEGPIVREAGAKRSKIELDDFSRWEFKPIPDSRERLYYFHIVSTGSVPAAICYDPTTSHPKLQLFRGGKDIGGRIGIHCYSKQVINDPYQFWIMQNEPHWISLKECGMSVNIFRLHRRSVSYFRYGTRIWNCFVVPLTLSSCRYTATGSSVSLMAGLLIPRSGTLSRNMLIWIRGST
jgi:hypothetical protein